ncbi:MAG: holo-ACP synthase [Thermoanaerobaculia bacterium]
MALLLGIDLTEVARVAKALDRWNGKFLDRVFEPGEISRRRRHPRAFAEHVAGRFAAKEAAMKALGTGWRGVAFREIVIEREPSGKPRLRLQGRALRRAQALGVTAAEISITHTPSMAAAVVALQTSDAPPRASGVV